MSVEPHLLKQTFETPLARVWKAITDPEQMRQWFFDAIEGFEPKAGFETKFNVECEGRNFFHLWKVTEVVPEKRIVYRWRYHGYPGDSTVSWELSETVAGTKLLFTQVFHEPYPQDDPMFSREAGRKGWEYFIDGSLPEFLHANPLPREQAD
ncbi:MAG: SRPBCC family protein [Fuerstiella sp.]